MNELPEPTAVHWHGIELESYYDGVAGFAGDGKRIAPPIAPGDSFDARFTPPRAGTFIYHTHVDEVRQQQAGLSGALLVVDAPEAYDPRTRYRLLVTVPPQGCRCATSCCSTDRRRRRRARCALGRALSPALHQRAHLPAQHAHAVLQDSTLLTWRALAKDGMDLPAEQALEGPP